MWSVSNDFLAALQSAPEFVHEATYTVPGGQPQEFTIESGSLKVDGTQNTRRTCDLQITGNNTVYAGITTPGTLVDIASGVKYGTQAEMVPVFHGEITTPAQDFGAGFLTVSAGDMSVRLARNKFITPFTADTFASRVAVIAVAVTTSIPGATVINKSSDSGRVGAANTWDVGMGPLDVIGDLTKDGGTEAFFQPDGTFLIRDRPGMNSPTVWTLSRTLKSASRTRSMASLFNAVVFAGSTTAGNSWPAQIIQLEDTTNPLHSNYIGVSPYIYSGSTANSQAEANSAARSILNQMMGIATTLSLTSVANPALEAGDVLTVITPSLGQEPAQSFWHFVDSFSFDFETGSMPVSTRSAPVTNV